MKFTNFRRGRVFLAAFCFSAFGVHLACAQTPAPIPSTTQTPQWGKLLQKAGLQPNSFAAIVMPAHQGEAILAINAQALMAPASTMKLLTSFIALDSLGPQFKWKTQFLSEAPIQDGKLQTNLYLRGGADPNLTWDRLSLMLRNLRQQGLREIEGDIVLDRSYFQPSRPDLTETLIDENTDAYYNLIPDALLINGNLTAIDIDTTSGKAVAQLQTPLDQVQLQSQLKLNDKNCTDWKQGLGPIQISNLSDGKLKLNLVGSFPRQCQITQYLNILDRNLYIDSLIRALWRELGGQWQGKVIDGITPANAKILHERSAESLADTLRIVNKYSDNSMARIVFSSLGAEANTEDKTLTTNKLAQAKVHRWLVEHAIDDTGLSVENGSGLSRSDRISAYQLAQILRLASNHVWYPEFAASLPIVGIDGTMRKRLLGSTVAGRARIKTGYLKNAIAVAGYVRDQHEQEWIVVAFINQTELDALKGKALLDLLLEWVATGQTTMQTSP